MCDAITWLSHSTYGLVSHALYYKKGSFSASNMLFSRFDNLAFHIILLGYCGDSPCSCFHDGISPDRVFVNLLLRYLIDQVILKFLFFVALVQNSGHIVPIIGAFTFFLCSLYLYCSRSVGSF